MVRVRVDIENISTVVTHSSHQQTTLRDELLQQSDLHQRVDQRVGRLVELLENQSNRLQDGHATQLGPFYRAPLPNRRQRGPALKPRRPSQGPSQLEGVSVKVMQYASACQPKCPCSCHEYKKSASPAFLDRVLGQMFIGYTGLPLFSPKCTSQECQKGQVPRVSLEYWFPLGFFWSQIVSVQAGFSQSFGPQFQMRTLRRVPDSAPCVNFALEGNIEALKDLFARGLASPQDVSSTRGYSLLRVSRIHLRDEPLLNVHAVGSLRQAKRNLPISSICRGRYRLQVGTLDILYHFAISINPHYADPYPKMTTVRKIRLVTSCSKVRYREKPLSY